MYRNKTTAETVLQIS